MIFGEDILLNDGTEDWKVFYKGRKLTRGKQERFKN